jgi:hypothetical protein
MPSVTRMPGLAEPSTAAARVRAVARVDGSGAEGRDGTFRRGAVCPRLRISR